MDRNVGDAERRARIGLGAAFLAVALGIVAFGGGLGLAAQLTVVVVALLLAAVMLVTARTRKCPVNHAAGRNTYRKE